MMKWDYQYKKHLEVNMANPYNSPWLIPAKIYIKDNILRHKYNQIKFHTTTDFQIAEFNGTLTLTKNTTRLYIAKNSIKFRIKSHLDWAWYTPKTLAQAIDNDTLDSYYEIMLTNINSDPNIWKDSDFELQLKSFYAARAGRASLI